MLKDVPELLPLTTITASGPTEISPWIGLTSTEITVLLSVEGVSTQRSRTGRQKTGRTYGRRRVKGERTAEPPVTLNRGGTPRYKVEKAPSRTAGTKERPVSRQEKPADQPDQPDQPGVSRWSPHKGLLIFLSKSRSQGLDLSKKKTIRIPSGTKKADPSPGRPTEPEAWTDLRPTWTRTPKCLVGGWRSGTAPKPKR